ncbi:hypothetical protein [Denitrobaculum tricleocarpae]|uniref:Uncharacterized protein n=1 Tax=Denitrobaculum tricleocarpae TaxID=2591009 RepID=A0A545TKU9_9PROT|nr:hypothetical protein [Denitrobaculum tricleocarpae]TQV77852.1 hypothetical protein FKG95_20075 [Denitrobaculum tricleocarpae]
MAMFAAACSLGLLTGLLIGLSTSGVTGSVVSAVLAMAAGVVALTGVKNPFLPKGENAAERSAGHNWAVSAFALLTIVGLGSGLWARTHDLLSPAPGEIAARWTGIGLAPEVAQRIAVLQLSGLSLNAEGEVKAESPEALKKTASILFSGVSDADCQRTDPSRAPDAAEARNTWSLAPEPWPDLAAGLADLPIDSLQTVWASHCEGASR